MRRANLSKSTQETPEPDGEGAQLVDPLGREDHSATTIVYLDDEEGNTKPRQVSKSNPAQKVTHPEA